MTLLCACGRKPDIGVTTLKPATLEELKRYFLDKEPDFDQFKLRGPYAVTMQADYELRLTGNERIKGDLYLSEPRDPAPLVILLHGLDNSKETHAYQGMHLASWGMHCLSLQLPNNGPWVGNGNTLARIVKLVRARPEIIDSRVDPERMVLVGHSYGGSAVAIALAQGAPAVGGILLDPASISRVLPAYLAKIRTPVLVIGADTRVSITRSRNDFFYYVHSNVAEISITGASHEDAQFPLDTSYFAFPAESSDWEGTQIAFLSALTSAAFSLGFTGSLDYAWRSFGRAQRSGRMYGARRK